MDKKQLLENARHIHKLSGDTIARLEAELAEAEKPKLQHGDIAEHDDTKKLYLHVWYEGHLRPICVDSCYMNQHPKAKCYTKRGSLKEYFADLKAISEDLEKTETVSPADLATTYWIDKAGDLLIDIKTNEKQTVVKAEDIPELILNLRRLQATARKKNDNHD